MPPPAGKGALCDGHRAGDRTAHEEPARERLAHVARAVEVIADDALSNPLVVGVEVHRVALQGGDDLLGGVHAGVHCVVDPLELGHVHHPGAVPRNDHARHRQRARKGPESA